MGLDHSLTYKERKLKNIPHRRRLAILLSLLEKIVPAPVISYADVGCSNGYVTALIADKFKPARSFGFDHDPSNLDVAATSYPYITFGFIDLNGATAAESGTYDVVTCFETLEHAGNLRQALTNLVKMTKAGGLLVLTVPIEIGIVGLSKFFAKTVIYGYTLDELPRTNNMYLRYCLTLLSGRRISVFRDRAGKTSWGTHFGFDYRDVDELLEVLGVRYTTFNDLTTRFYVVQLVS